MKAVRQTIRNIDALRFRKFNSWCRHHRIDVRECVSITFEDDMSVAHFSMYIRNTGGELTLNHEQDGVATVTVDRTVFEPFPLPEFITDDSY